MSLDLKEYQKRALKGLRAYLEQARVSGPAAAFELLAEQEGVPVPYRPIADDQGQPVAALVPVPYVCLRIPTGGGKTVMGAHIIRAAAETYLERDKPLVLWLVPSKQIKSQTLEAFKNPRHPYRRELDDAFGGQVAVFDIADAGQIRPQDIAERLCLVIGTLATARVNDTEIRDFYAHKEDLEPHFLALGAQRPALDTLDGGGVKFSFANLLKLHRPLVITDEAHNATSSLSVVVYERLSPAAIVELTATPDMAASNVLVRVSASELKEEQMIKLPVVLKEHAEGWEEAVRDALQRRSHLETLAEKEPDYLRPILLIQAENDNQVATVARIREHLLENERIPADQVKVATGDQRELDGVDLFDRDCPVRVIITKDALKEGWDCSFAYVLCSVTNQRSGTAIEQLLGRVLRMPYARRRQHEDLNRAYAHVVSEHFGTAAQELTDDLENMGFNPVEAATSIIRQPALGLSGGATMPLLPETLTLTLPKAPNLANMPAADRERVVVEPAADGAGVTVRITGRIDEITQAAVVATLPRGKQAEASKRLTHHNIRAAASETPAQKGAEFVVPKLAWKQGALTLEVSADLVLDLNGWNLLDYPAETGGFGFDEQNKTFTLDLDGHKVVYTRVEEPEVGYLEGIAGDWNESELVLWLDRRVRQRDVNQTVLVEWVRQAVSVLTARGFSLPQLLRGKYVLARLLLDQIDHARRKAVDNNYQQTLFASDAPVLANFDHAYRFDPLAYPARWHCPANMKWSKHYYAIPGELPHKRKDGTLAEEFQCAQQLDFLDPVEFWVRNLAHESQFWLPTATGRTYPDFVAKLKDGRLLVIEYKGGDRVSNNDSKHKKQMGELWAKASGGKCVYLMAVPPREAGMSLQQQMLAAIK